MLIFVLSLSYPCTLNVGLICELDRPGQRVCHPLSFVTMFQEKMADEPQIESRENQSDVGASGAPELR